MKIITTLLFLMVASSTYSADSVVPSGVDVSQQDVQSAAAEMMKSFSLNKKDIFSMLDMLVKQGKLTKAEADKTKKKLEGMSQEELDSYSKSAMEMMTNQVKTIDLPKGQ